MDEIRGLRSDLARHAEERDSVHRHGALIGQELKTLTKRVEEFASRDEKDHVEMRGCIEVVRVLLTGDKDTLGLLVRIDRIEQDREARGRVFWWALGIFGGVVTALVVIVAQIKLTGHL